MSSGNKGFRKGMALSFQNIASLEPQFNELADLVRCKGVHILGLNETKLDSSFPDSLTSIDGYSLERNDRNSFGGGVAHVLHPQID